MPQLFDPFLGEEVVLPEGQKKLYPPSVYFGITDDPETWGMCCSEEMARKCAEEHYDEQQKAYARERRIFLIVSAVVGAIAGVFVGIFIL